MCASTAKANWTASSSDANRVAIGVERRGNGTRNGNKLAGSQSNALTWTARHYRQHFNQERNVGQRDEYDSIDKMNASTIVHGYEGYEHGVVKVNMLKLRHAIDRKFEATPAMVFGQQYHAYLLEPEEFDQRFVVMPNFAKDPNNVDSKNNPSTSAATKWAKEMKAEFLLDAGSRGQEVMTENDHWRCKHIAASLRHNQKAMEIIRECETEVTLEGVIEDVPFKGRLDLYHPLGLYFADIKGCVSATDWDFGKKQCQLNIDIKTAVYRELMGQQFGSRPQRVDLIAVESDAPYDSAVYRVPDDLIDFGYMKLVALLKAYKTAKEKGVWPGTQPYCSGDAPYMHVPNWAMPDDEADDVIQGYDAE